MMKRVVIAGTNGLAQFIAHFIATTTSHQFVFLSRFANAGLSARGWQVLQVDYTNKQDLAFKIAGADTVISTIHGNPQLILIEAAAAAGVRRFVPSEFQGPPSARSERSRDSASRRAALSRLRHHEPSGMAFTVFTCGVFYERFAPGGMAASQIGLQSDIGREGEYVMNIRRRTAIIPALNNAGRPVYFCMTSARDVARFVAAALDLPRWPREFRLRGERMLVSEAVSVAEHVIVGQQFERSTYTSESLQDALIVAQAVRDRLRESRLQHLIATADGEYDFEFVNLNRLLVNVRPERFQAFLIRVWDLGRVAA